MLKFWAYFLHMSTAPVSQNKAQRLISLDFMRGFIMVLLALESAGLYESLSISTRGTSYHLLIMQFFHHPWNGLHFWDLVQPAFMFMAGVAMAISLKKQTDLGISWNQRFRKILKRCFWLFFWGVLDYAVRPNGLSFELWDVLTQLSFTTLVAFLVFRWPALGQLIFCTGLLLLTEFLYMFSDIPYFNQPFTDRHNFGNYLDLLLMHKINAGGWVAINCLPTSVHTIAGCLAGRLLLSDKGKIKPLLFWAGICLMLGYGLDFLHITPIIKRIATSSFILASLGWCLFALAFCYWWIDIKNHKKYILFFLIVGMNSIFIYLFFEIVGDRWFTAYLGEITNGLMGLLHTPQTIQLILSSLVVFFLEWLLCYFLYRKNIFFKL
jgi:predicted acyltransferase